MLKIPISNRLVLMDMLPEIFNVWLLNYGSFALFCLLALGIVALPIPEETLLVFSGFLISQGTLSPIPTATAAYFGSILGITGSYLIGLTGGLYVVKKYGRYIGLNEEKMVKVHNWFEHYGKWVLVIGYFIPGVRHFTGIFAGVSTMEYHHFALYAFSGAFLWVCIFLSLGYFFGNLHQVAFELIERNVDILMYGAIFLVLFAIAIRFWTNKKPS
jgi:membrane protein DedA with SNARE-associated domain